MRVDVFVPTISTEEQVRFYVQELGLFAVGQDYGMGSILLRHVDSPSFCILLQPGCAPSIDRPLFCISTANCRSEFARLLRLSFEKGGLVPAPDGSVQVFEYPLGESISLKDASGKWHPNAF
ncbi:hypothetical protein [Paenibacillus tyrfis]|uniref:Glyoxalase n=1 Tax=Paenibacillus tyrfis TaxID=1501230 RepID=A0A081NVT1_9BACL|nr:hypothetical protein [Paenibacillus tyrfis]KEQ22554.1 hypothetical protein ET33_22975 [Paenibacillus tyrfis]